MSIHSDAVCVKWMHCLTYRLYIYVSQTIFLNFISSLFIVFYLNFFSFRSIQFYLVSVPHLILNNFLPVIHSFSLSSVRLHERCDVSIFITFVPSTLPLVSSISLPHHVITYFVIKWIPRGVIYAQMDLRDLSLCLHLSLPPLIYPTLLCL